jgi:PIN domain nuclease of toxin-antitoxin system
MKVLLDTHALIWAMEESPSLSPRAADIMARGEVAAFVSIASLWEIAIKLSTGKLRLPDDWLDSLTTHLAGNGVGLLAILPAHCGRVAALPFHHRDPFDRMLAAQAQEENLSIVSADPAFDAYGIERIW